MTKGLSCPYGHNNLISSLSSADRELIEPEFTPVDLNKGFVLEEAGAPINLVYFPTSGVGSTVASTTNGRCIEVGLFGLEGMSGTTVVLHGSHSTYKTFMQVGGKGMSIRADTLFDLCLTSALMGPNSGI
jgi:CRP-like cAMP-binding protein